MKKIFLLGLLLFPVTGFAQSDHSISWELVGVDTAIEVELDFDIGTTYVSTHGAFRDSGGNIFGTSGTCFINDVNQLFCDLFLALGFSGVLIIDPESLNGTYTEYDVEGNLFEDGDALFLRIN